MSIETIWLIIGFGGQGLFFARWIVQWFRSERERESTIPVSFWYLSLIGGLITLAYAIYRNRPASDVAVTAAPHSIQAGGGPADAPPVPTPKS